MIIIIASIVAALVAYLVRRKYVEDQLYNAQSIMHHAHEGQFRRNGVTPYVNHPIDVASRVDKWYEKMVAYMHDVIEDSGLEREDLVYIGIPEFIIEAVELLTKKKGQSYEDYLILINNNPIARAVKIADMQSNLSDSPTERQIKKYTKGLEILGYKSK
jgi:(p)ppGpp synthase/HD superfamily hydrolase